MDTDIRVVAVDDHTLFRQGLVRLLEMEPGFQVVGECAAVDEAVQIVCRTHPDIVLLDVDLPGRPARDFFDLLPPDSACVALLVTAVRRDAEIARLLYRGAKGVFFKGTDCARLPGAIRQALAGEMWVDQVYLRAFIAAAAGASEEADVPVRSGREQDVLSFVCRGFSNKQIAEKLDCSEAAVKATLQRLFRKFGTTNRAQLLAVSAGLMTRDR